MNTKTRAPAHLPRSALLAVGAAAGLLLLAACGSNGATTTTRGPSSSSATTVTVRDDGGTTVLATPAGDTLYTSSQEQGRVLCTSTACHAVWEPLTVAASQKPTAPDGLTPDLGTLDLHNGARQVTFDGRPLYTFAFDRAAGQLNGDGQSDSFGGTSFTWHAAVASGAAPTSGPSPRSGYGYGY